VLVCALTVAALIPAAGGPAAFGSIDAAGGDSPPPPSPTSSAALSPRGLPNPIARAAVLQDLDTGQVLFAKAPDERRPIASLTKVMTAMIVLDRSDLDDDVVVSTAAIAQPGSDPPLVDGERLSVRDLLYAMLLPSSNDAAVALAEHVAGTEAGFVEMMNRRATELGLRDTFFFSASGFDDRGHSTAADVAALARAAYRLPAFARIVRTKDRRFPSPSGGTVQIQNRNILLWYLPGTIGAKTGYTAPAGSCLVAVAERDGVTLVAVVLGHPDSAFGDGAALLDYGFRRFERRVVLERGQAVGTVMVAGRAFTAVAGRTVEALVSRRAAPAPRLRFRSQGGLVLPLLPGDQVGRVTVFVEGRGVRTVPAIVAGEPPASPTPSPSPSSVSTGPTPKAQPALGREDVLATAETVIAVVRELATAFL
jgi:D-alanyl-D-alanine carboxypeptidase (penicillin-binding protein 5/6)